ncbi:MAG: diphthine synthase [Candidatus Aenigmatarchaeota archaeon]
MIYLIGLGIGSEKDISVRGIEACGKCAEVCAELYTAKWPGSLKRLEGIIGKKIAVLSRADMEEDVGKLVKRAADRDIAILMPGDPLSATTHIGLMMEARERKVRVEVVHASSILTAVAETGLSLYNFGRTVTVVSPQAGYAPASFYDAAGKNKSLGMHTLLLLDVGMDSASGIRVLMGIGEKKKRPLVAANTMLVAANLLGTPAASIRYGKARELLKRPFEPPAVLILPGKLHFTEKEYLEAFSIKGS